VLSKYGCYTQFCQRAAAYSLNNIYRQQIYLLFLIFFHFQASAAHLRAIYSI